nr:N-acetylmuramoyl-L-alanine amidase [Wenxinia saemankumensis]
MGSRALPRCRGAQLTHRLSPSPNHGERRDGARPRFVVIHYTAMASCAAAEARLRDPAFEVSAHWLIGRDGEVISLVPEERRAWHAGAGEWRGCRDINSASIGIELDNDGRSAFPGAQIAALEAVLRGIRTRWQIGADGVIGHADMAYLRKSDPGPLFPWGRLHKAGLAVAPPPVIPARGRPLSLAEVIGRLCRFGYRRPEGADESRAMLIAVKDRFLPFWRDAPLLPERGADEPHLVELSGLALALGGAPRPGD